VPPEAAVPPASSRLLGGADRLAEAVRTVAGVLLVVVAIAMITVIAGRYVGFSTAWADEVARISFVWSAGLGAASGTYRGLNFAVPLLAPRREGRSKQVLESTIALLVAGLCALVLWATTKSLPVAHLNRLPALGVTGAWFHAAIAAYATLTAAFMLVRTVALWRTPA
jgi:TRAP-type C4-dicarboxylate transport system permease small subunit